MEIQTAQELVMQISKDGVSLSAYSYVYLALVSLVSAAGGAFFASYFKKSGEEQYIHDNFESIKTRLASTTQLTEEIKASIGIGNIEHQIKFSKLHEKRIAVIEGLYHRLVKMEDMGRNFLYYASPNNPQANTLKEAEDAISDFVSYSKLNKFWVEEDLFNEIEQTAIKIDKIVWAASFRVHINPQDFQAVSEALNKNVEAIKQINTEIYKAKEDIISSIRKTLKPEKS